MKGILSWLGGFIQQTVQTNTAMEIAGDIADIRFDHKRGEGIWSLVVTSLVAGGGATLFVLEPAINNYFKTIILQGLPFLGNVASTVFVGVIGAWFGGGFGANVSKELIRYYNARGGNHTNSDYNNLDAKVQDIITANPTFFNQQPDLEQGQNPLLMQGLDQHQFTGLLNKIVDLIDEHRGDGSAAHDEYKRVLLAATQQLNLMPLAELLNKNLAKRDARIDGSLQIANYINNLPQNVLNNLADRAVARQAGQPVQQARLLRRRRPLRRELAVQPNANLEHVDIAQPAPLAGPNLVDAQALPLNPQAQHVPPAMEPVPLMNANQPNHPIYKNTYEHFMNLNHARVVDPRRSPRIKPTDPDFVLSEEKRNALLYQLQVTMHQQADKKEKDRTMAQPVSSLVRGVHR